MRDGPVYRAEGLRRSYDGRVVVEDFTATVQPGEVAVVVGPNGCGKTTSVEMSLGLRRADAGRAFIDGYDVHREPRKASQSVGVALQGASLNGRVRVREHLQFFAALFRTDTHALDIASQLGLDERVRRSLYGSLSGGQQRRVLVATALAGRPRLAVLDEPTSGVDIESRIALWTALRAVQDQTGTAFLVTTHDLGEAEQYADTVIVMREGRVAYTGAPVGFVRSAGLEVIAGLRCDQLTAFDDLPLDSAVLLRVSGREATIGLTSGAGLEPLRRWIANRSDRNVTLSERTPTFEDAYLFTFGVRPSTGNDSSVMATTTPRRPAPPRPSPGRRPSPNGAGRTQR